MLGIVCEWVSSVNANRSRHALSWWSIGFPVAHPNFKNGQSEQDCASRHEPSEPE